MHSQRNIVCNSTYKSSRASRYNQTEMYLNLHTALLFFLHAKEQIPEILEKSIKQFTRKMKERYHFSFV